MAAKWRILSVNPADAVEAPKPTKKKVRPLDETETVRLLAAAKGTAWHLPLLLAVATGMRRGEIFGLRWADVNLDAGTVAVRQTLVQTRAGLAFAPTKTDRPRVVTLPALAVEALRRHRRDQAAARLAAGPAYRDHGLVLAAPEGVPWPPENFTTGFRKWAHRAGFTGLRFHDLRHGHASHLLRQKIPLKVVSERLGHSSIGITADLYTHVLDGMDAEAAAKLDAALREAGIDA